MIYFLIFAYIVIALLVTYSEVEFLNSREEEDDVQGIVATSIVVVVCWVAVLILLTRLIS